MSYIFHRKGYEEFYEHH